MLIPANRFMLAAGRRGGDRLPARRAGQRPVRAGRRAGRPPARPALGHRWPPAPWSSPRRAGSCPGIRSSWPSSWPGSGRWPAARPSHGRPAVLAVPGARPDQHRARPAPRRCRRSACASARCWAAARRTRASPGRPASPAGTRCWSPSAPWRDAPAEDFYARGCCRRWSCWPTGCRRWCSPPPEAVPDPPANVTVLEPGADAGGAAAAGCRGVPRRDGHRHRVAGPRGAAGASPRSGPTSRRWPARWPRPVPASRSPSPRPAPPSSPRR